MRSRHVLSLLAGGVAAAAFASNAHAVTYVEAGDAGELPGTAQVAGLLPPLTEIDGTIGPLANGGAVPGDRDMYQFTLVAGGSVSVAFSVPVPGGPGNPQLNPALFLFDSTGKAIIAEDDISIVDSAVAFSTNLGPGTYNLLIAQGNTVIPQSGVTDLFGNPPLVGGAYAPTNTLLPVTGYRSSALTGGEAASTHDVGYVITISAPGAGGAIPEPVTATMGGMGLAALGMSLVRRRRTA